MNPKLRMALDFGPLGLFFVTFQATHDIATATLLLIIFTLAALLVIYLYEKKLAPMPLISGLAVAFFGGLTLYLQNETFIKMKPTFVNLLFSCILLGGLAYGKTLLKPLLSSALEISERGWKNLTFRWGVFFLFLAALNEFIWRNFPTDFWVSFKVFGMLTITMVFSLCQIPLIKREWIGDER